LREKESSNFQVNLAFLRRSQGAGISMVNGLLEKSVIRIELPMFKTPHHKVSFRKNR
jgi:hypothetical protein